MPPSPQSPTASVVTQWAGNASPLVMDSVWSEGTPSVERDGVFLLNLTGFTAAFVDRPLIKPPLSSYAPTLRPLPGGAAVQFASVYTSGAVDGPKTRTPDGPWAWDLASQELSRLPFPKRPIHIGPMISPPNPLTMRDGRLRFGVISEVFTAPNPIAEYTMGFADAVTGEVTASVPLHDTYRVETGSIVAMSSAPHGEYAATTRFWQGRGGLEQAILIINPSDGSIAQEILNARLVGHNGWSPSGRQVMILEDHTELWAVHDLHTQKRRHIQLNRANAADFGDPEQYPFLIGWIDEETVLISTRKRSHLHMQTLDLASGHRQPVLVIKDKRVAHSWVHGVPDTMHLWEPLLP